MRRWFRRQSSPQPPVRYTLTSRELDIMAALEGLPLDHKEQLLRFALATLPEDRVRSFLRQLCAKFGVPHP